MVRSRQSTEPRNPMLETEGERKLRTGCETGQHAGCHSARLLTATFFSCPAKLTPRLLASTSSIRCADSCEGSLLRCSRRSSGPGHWYAPIWKWQETAGSKYAGTLVSLVKRPTDEELHRANSRGPLRVGRFDALTPKRGLPTRVHALRCCCRTPRTA